MIKKFLSQINPIEVIKALKKTDTAVQIKGYTQMGGGGVLITSGVVLIEQGSEKFNDTQVICGVVLLIIGAYLAKNLTVKIEKIKEENK